MKIGEYDAYEERGTKLRRRIGIKFQKPNPPNVDLRNIAAGLSLMATATKHLDDVVEEILVSSALWDEVKDSIHHPELVSPVASSSGCALHARWQLNRKCC